MMSRANAIFYGAFLSTILLSIVLNQIFFGVGLAIGYFFNRFVKEIRGEA